MTGNRDRAALSKSNTGVIRGFCALLVLTGHIGAELTGSNAFGLLGSLPVGFFLFISGYGMMSRLDGDAGYTGDIPRRRVIPVLIPFILANAVYFPVKLLLGLFDGVNAAGMLFGGGGIVTYSWYIVAILYFYAAFYFSFRFAKKYPLIILFAFAAVWIGAMLISGGGAHRYVSACCFPIGAAVYRCRTALLPRLAKPMTTAALLISTAAAYAVCVYCWDRRVEYPVVKLLLALSILLFVLLLTGAATRFDMKSRVLTALDGISLELYLVHGLFMLLYRCEWCYISSPVIYVAAVLASSIVAAVLFNKLNGIIVPRILSIFRKKPAGAK